VRLFKAGVILFLCLLFLGCSLGNDVDTLREQTEKSYTVTFNSNGGSNIAVQTVKSGGMATRPANPTQSGYTFENWYSDDGLTTVYDFSAKITKNITLYAKWNIIPPSTFTVTFNSNGGSDVATQTVISGNAATRPANPALSGYAFDNWYSDEGLTTVYNFSTPVTGNKTLYAKWNEIPPGSFVVTFNSNEGSGISDQIVVSGGTATRPDNPTLIGYTFGDWYSDEELSAVYNFSTPVTENITLYAQWTPITYTVIYDKNAADATGTMESSSHIYDVDNNLNTNAFTRTGYTFTGWARTATGGMEFTDGQNVSNLTAVAEATVTLYAKWILNQYTVTFNADSGTPAPPPQTVDHGDKVTAPAAMTRTGCTFGGWFKEETLTNQWDFTNDIVTGAITLYAKWTLNRYTVTFNANSGTPAPSSQTVEHGGKITPPAAMTRTGYTFGGWFRENSFTNQWNQENDTVTGAITLHAQWNPITYSIAYNKNADDVIETMTDSSHTYDVDKYLTLNAFVRADYTFAGWARTPTGPVEFTNGQSIKNLSITAEETVTLYAVWMETSTIWTVSFNTNGGSLIGEAVILRNTPVSRPVPDPSRTGYTFDNWYKNEGLTEPYNFSSIVIGNITLYAKWNPITYTVTYEKNATDATGTMTDSSHTYDIDQDLNNNAFTRTGYTFAGWARSSTGAVEFTDGESVVNLTSTAGVTVTLFVKWNPITYIIAYNKNAADATGTMDSSSHTYDVDKNLSAIAYSRTGYTFAGWAKTEGGTVEFTDGANVKNLSATAGATVTLYAKWNPITYTVTYVKNAADASGTMTNSSHTYDVDKDLNDNAFVRTGYTFDGWARTSTGAVEFTDGVSVKNLTYTAGAIVTLYAKWNPITYTVIYNKNAADATGTMDNSSHTYDVDKNLSAIAFNRTDYAFAGWSRTAGGSVEFTDNQSVKNLTAENGATVTLYAKWNNIPGSGVINVPFTGPTEKIISITRDITNNLSKSNGGAIALTINESFDRYEWFAGTTHVASGNNVTLQASNMAFTPGINWITAVVYTGTGASAIPWSGEFFVYISE